jgi:spermidine synthase
MGSLACHAKDGERWDFFEIDPEVVRLARDTRYFRSLSVCGPEAKVVLGDGRLTLADADSGFDLIVLDAFSSDSVPVHLLTREALAGYLAKLAPGGAIIFNISNRHMDLDDVIASSASANDLVAFAGIDDQSKVDFKQTLGLAAFVAIVAREAEDLGAIAASTRWRRVVPSPGTRAWTDDYSNILAPILRKYGWR